MLISNFVGIDVSKSTFDVAFLHEKNYVKNKFSNSNTGFQEFLIWINKYIGTHFFCLESTGPYSENLANFLYENKQHIYMLNPLAIKNFARSQLARNKNDRYDAQLIADYLAYFRSKLRPYRPKTQTQRELRELVSIFDKLVDNIKAMQTRKQTLASSDAQHFIEKTIGDLKERKKELEKTMRKLMKNDNTLNKQADLLFTIPSVGIATVARLLAYIQDIHAFKSAKNLASYAGLSPQQKSSGTYNGKTRLSKIGDKRLRSALYMSAMQLLCRNKELEGFVERLRKNGLCNMAIIGALMRKLIHIVFGVLKHEKPYDPKLV